MQNFVDENKLIQIPQNTLFGYRNVVSDSLDKEDHSKYGKVFKNQVEDGLIEGVVIEKETDSRMLYKKLK